MQFVKQLIDDYGVAVAALAIAFGFVARQAWVIGYGHFAERLRRRRLIAALYSEIIYNTTDLKHFLETADRPEDLARVLEGRASKALHMTDARHTAIYSQNIQQLSMLPQVAIMDLVAFYAQLEKIKAQVDAVSDESFKQISDAGRTKVILRIWRAIRIGKMLGDKALERFRTEKRLKSSIDAQAGDEFSAYMHKLETMEPPPEAPAPIGDGASDAPDDPVSKTRNDGS